MASSQRFDHGPVERKVMTSLRRFATDSIASMSDHGIAFSTCAQEAIPGNGILDLQRVSYSVGEIGGTVEIIEFVEIMTIHRRRLFS